MPRKPLDPRRLDTRLLDRLSRAALVRAAGALDPLLRRKYADLAQSHMDEAIRLRRIDSGTHRPSITAWISWRPCGFLATNDP